jgi:oligopeptide/dipeptide ABC transporter ATP-binding protein
MSMSFASRVPVIAFKGVSVRFSSGMPWARRHVHALCDIDLEITAGETLGVVGESGSGKTTLARLALGLLAPSAGRVEFQQRLVQGRHGYPRGSIAAVLQHPQWSLNPRLSVGSSIAEPIVVLGEADRSERRKAVASMLDLVGLDSRMARRYPHELSGGQRQRASVARALITQPKFIVFDEATSALDVSMQAQILNLVLTLQEKVGFAAMFISHDLAAVRYVARNVAVLYAGQLVEYTQSRLLYGPAHHPYTRCLQQASGLIDQPEFRLKGNQLADHNLGCCLRGRCPIAVSRCAEVTPHLGHHGGSRVACHRAEELASQTDQYLGGRLACEGADGAGKL